MCFVYRKNSITQTNTMHGVVEARHTIASDAQTCEYYSKHSIIYFLFAESSVFLYIQILCLFTIIVFTYNDNDDDGYDDATTCFCLYPPLHEICNTNHNNKILK